MNTSGQNIRVLPAERLDALLALLREAGYRCIGPVLRDGAIVYDTLDDAASLPRGWTDEQSPGHYRLQRRDDEALFGYNVGPHSWKRLLFPPDQLLWRLRATDEGFERVDAGAEPPRLALIGVRACELAAIRVQDRVFLGGDVVETDYLARRENCLIVAVSCTESAETCFCASLGTGPQQHNGFDIEMTEVLEPEHILVMRGGSDRGVQILEKLPTRIAEDWQLTLAESRVREAAESQVRRLDPQGLPDLLKTHIDGPHWVKVAERCLSCGNCTLVCPTCFCNNIEDQTDLGGEHAERWRRWDSCFNPGFSLVAGGELRGSIASRYRQWMTHKLAHWQDQFGTLGCVGCGRCLTWCPVGIDITAEVAKLREGEPA